MSTYPKQYFVANRMLMTYGGLWTPDNLTPFRLRLFKLYQFIMLMSSVVICNTAVWAGAFLHRNDFDFLIEYFNIAVTIALASVKCIFWLTRGHKIQDLIDILEDERLHYEEGPGFNPGLILSKTKKTATTLTMFYFITGQVTLASGYGTAFLAGTYHLIRGKPIRNVTSFQDLPYLTPVPFTYDTPSKYLLALVYQGMPLYFHAVNLVGHDMLVVNIMNFVGAHVEVLQGAFRTVRERSLRKITGPALDRDGLYNSKELEDVMMQEMRKCVEHLKTIFSVCEKLESEYTLITLGQVLCTVYVLCSSLLLLSTTPLVSKEFANHLGYLLAITIQASLYCWYGNEIALKASGIPRALWESEWLETRRPYRFCMMMTMMRMRRSLYITAGKFSPLTLGTFASIVKGSYSYYTVLKNMKQ